MSSTSRAYLVATSIGAVEALKDQGFARWNYVLRLLNQQAKNNFRSYSQAVKIPSSSSAFVGGDRINQSEESIRKVMYLSNWGPN